MQPRLSPTPLKNVHLSDHRNAFAYGLIGFPVALLGIPLYLYLPNFYHQYYELSLALIGSALLTARMLDVLTDPLIGWFSDHYKWRISRQLQVTAGAILMLVGSYQLFFPASSPDWNSLLIWSFITYLGWTIVQVPHQALNAEISTQSLVKTHLASYREAFSILGVLAVILIPAAYQLNPNEPKFYNVVYLLLAVMTLAGVATLFLIRAEAVFKRPDASQPPCAQKINFIATLSQLWLKQRFVFAIMPSYFINNLANAIPATLFMLFVSDYLQLEEQVGLFLLAYFAAGILALPVWIWISKHWGKTTSWQISMLFAGISFLGVFTLQAGDWLGFLVICLLTGVSLGVDIAMPSSIQADLSQKALQDDIPAAGLLFGIWGMLTKLSLALAVGISFPLLEWARESQFMPSITLLLLYAALPILLKTLAWWLLVKLQHRYEAVH